MKIVSYWFLSNHWEALLVGTAALAVNRSPIWRRALNPIAWQGYLAFEQRIEWASHLVNDATLCVEIIKDDVRKRTMLRRHQTRYDTGNLPSYAVAKFDNGRLVDLSVDELKALLADDAEGATPAT